MSILRRRVGDLVRRVVKLVQGVRDLVLIAFGFLFVVPFICVFIGGILAIYCLVAVFPRLIWRHILCEWRIFGRRRPGRPAVGADAEPARVVYVRGAGPRDLRLLWRSIRSIHAEALAEALREGSEKAVPSGPKPKKLVDVLFARLLYGSFGLFLVSATITVMLATAILFLPAVLFQLLAWGVWCAVWAAFCGLCRAVDQVGRRLTAAVTVCPHPDCGRAVALPVRLCPRCGARHRRLVPDRHGALRRICRCGARLPAATVFGARHLAPQCPYCSHQLLPSSARSTTRLVLTAGGPDAGRRTIGQSSLAQLAEYIDGFGGSVRPGIPGTGTALVAGLRGGHRSLVVLDPPDAAFADESAVDAVDGLRHANGLLLVVDPLALPSVRRALTVTDLARISALPVSSQDPAQAVARVLHAVHALPRRSRPPRIAVVLAKAAALQRTSAGSDLGDGQDAAVRRWLETAGAGNLVRAVERSGAQVRFLAAGAPAADATELGELLLWTAGIRAAPRRLPQRRTHPPRRRTVVRGAAEGKRQALRGARGARGALLLSHVAGFVALPLTLALLIAGVLPPSSLFGLPRAFDAWAHPLTEFNRDVDLTAYRQGINWPTFTASYSAPGSSPELVRAGLGGSWSTVGSPDGGDEPWKSEWLEIDFGAPIPISRVGVDFDPASVGFAPSFDIKASTGGGRWVAADASHNYADNPRFHESTFLYDFPVTTSRLRINVPHLLNGKGVTVDEVHVRLPSSTLLRLQPVGSGLRVTNTAERDLSIEALSPMLPPGWQAEPEGALPKRVAAGATVTAGWRVTASADARPGPVLYSVRITEDGHTATTTCVAMLSMTAAGPDAQGITCDDR